MACRDCPRVFKRRQSLVNHLRSKHLRRVHPCSACDLIFFTNDSYREHRNTHLLCPVCKQPFTEIRNLKRHERSKHLELTFSCGVCGEQFCRKEYLKIHMKKHTQDLFPKSKLPVADPTDLSQELLDALPPTYAQLYAEAWRLIRTQYALSNPIVMKFNFRFLSPVGLKEFRRMLFGVFSYMKVQFKFNLQFAYILRSPENDLRYFYASGNTSFFDSPIIVSCPEDVEFACSELDREDVLEWAKQQRPSTKFVLERITNALITVYPLGSHPLR